MGARVVITGGASGIGAAAAEVLRRRGARVVALDLKADGDVIACDVRSQESVDDAVAEAVDRLGGLDVLVNNAGVGLPQRAVDRPGDDALAVLDINLVGPWRVAAAALPALRESRGRIVNVASGLSFLSMPFAPAYCMSKRGVVAFSDSLRHEIGHEVTVTTVYPGYVRTSIHDESADQGFTLEGLVPSEELDVVSERLATAVLGRPRRDYATTRSGTLAYAVVRMSPQGIVDRVIRHRLRKKALAGAMDASPLARELGTALKR